jgi:para-nitrobenzyl esterase
MRTLILALAAVTAATGAQAQTAAPAPAATKAAHYSTATTEIGTLLDDPAAKALLDKHIPGMSSNEQVDMARGMTLKDIQQYSPDQITDKVLADLDADFAKIPAKPAK